MLRHLCSPAWSSEKLVEPDRLEEYFDTHPEWIGPNCFCRLKTDIDMPAVFLRPRGPKAIISVILAMVVTNENARISVRLVLHCLINLT